MRSGDRQILSAERCPPSRCGRHRPVRRISGTPRREARIQRIHARGHQKIDRGGDALHSRMRRIHVPPRTDGGQRRDGAPHGRRRPWSHMEHREALQIRLCDTPSAPPGQRHARCRGQGTRVPLLGQRLQRRRLGGRQEGEELRLHQRRRQPDGRLPAPLLLFESPLRP